MHYFIINYIISYFELTLIDIFGVTIGLRKVECFFVACASLVLVSIVSCSVDQYIPWHLCILEWIIIVIVDQLIVGFAIYVTNRHRIRTVQISIPLVDELDGQIDPLVRKHAVHIIIGVNVDSENIDNALGS